MRKIAIVHGGTSTEQAVSTVNAGCVEAALSRRGYQTFMVNYNRDMIESLYAIAPDLVWVCVQGKGHGDGTVQAALDFMGLNYTGSGALGAQIINDKILCKELFTVAGIRTPAWQTLSRAGYAARAFDFTGVGYPLVAKAPTQGASIGIELVMSADEHGKIEPVFVYDDPILIEKYIPGHMVTIGLLEREGTLAAFPPVGVRTDTEADRYELIKPDNPRPLVRIGLPPAVVAELEKAARAVFNVTRARDYARVDFMVSLDDGFPYALEINAVPGLRPPESALRCYFPKGAAEAGIGYDDMIETIALNALRKH
jgi:D-alanine--D-alanine ligase